MPSTTTKTANVIVPEVMKPIIGAKIEALLKLTPYARVNTDLVGVPGNEVTVPAWQYSGDGKDFDPEAAYDAGTEMETDRLTATSTKFGIKCAYKSISILQTAINSGLGNPVAQANKQLAMGIAGKVDTDVVSAAYGATTLIPGASVISYEGIVAGATSFEDENDGIDKVLFIHPAQEAALLTDPDFLSADKFAAGVAVNGSIGRIAGCWVKKSKKVKLCKYEKDNTNGTVTITADNLAQYQAETAAVLAVGDKVKALTEANWQYADLILKMEPDSSETEYTEDELPAITIFLKKETELDHEWFPKKQRHDLTATRYYGVALTNSAKVVVCTFKKTATV